MRTKRITCSVVKVIEVPESLADCLNIMPEEQIILAVEYYLVLKARVELRAKVFGENLKTERLANERYDYSAIATPLETK